MARKHYSAFLVPRGAPGLSINEMPGFHALENCLVPVAAILGPMGTAYERMALSFRDVEETVGTFGMTTLSSRNTGLVYVPSPCATTLTYGPIAPDGTVDVRLGCDHRVLDGMTAARALEALQSALSNAILTELSAVRLPAPPGAE